MTLTYFDCVRSWALGQMAAAALIQMGCPALVAFAASFVAVLLATAIESWRNAQRI